MRRTGTAKYHPHVLLQHLRMQRAYLAEKVLICHEVTSSNILADVYWHAASAVTSSRLSFFSLATADRKATQKTETTFAKSSWYGCGTTEKFKAITSGQTLHATYKVGRSDRFKKRCASLRGVPSAIFITIRNSAILKGVNKAWSRNTFDTTPTIPPVRTIWARATNQKCPIGPTKTRPYTAWRTRRKRSGVVDVKACAKRSDKNTRKADERAFVFSG